MLAVGDAIKYAILKKNRIIVIYRKLCGGFSYTVYLKVTIGASALSTECALNAHTLIASALET